MKTPPRTCTANRETLILKLSQCHLNPGWNATRQRELFERYNIGKVEDWDRLSDIQLGNMAKEAGL